MNTPIASSESLQIGSVDFVSPDERYSVADYKKDAKKLQTSTSSILCKKSK